MMNGIRRQMCCRPLHCRWQPGSVLADFAITKDHVALRAGAVQSCDSGRFIRLLSDSAGKCADLLDLLVT